MGYLKGIYRGSKNANARLTEAEVRMIKTRLYTGESAPSISRDFYVSTETIRRIARGETWSWLDIADGSTEAQAQLASPKEVLQSDVEKSLAETLRRMNLGK